MEFFYTPQKNRNKIYLFNKLVEYEIVAMKTNRNNIYLYNKSEKFNKEFIFN